MYRTAKRVVIFVVGFTVVLIGLALTVLPGPAIIVIPLGLAILATEFAWAKFWLRKYKDTSTSIWENIKARFRKVEHASSPDPPQCRKCGSSLRESTSGRCPNCDTPKPVSGHVSGTMN